MLETQETLLVIKPDAVKRGLMGEIITRIEAKNLKIRAMEMRSLDRETVERLYESHKGQEYYERLVQFMLSGPIVAIRIEGPAAIQLVRNLMGSTDPRKAQPGSIRGDFCSHRTENLCHGSDEPANATRELGILFPEHKAEESLGVGVAGQGN